MEHPAYIHMEGYYPLLDAMYNVWIDTVITNGNMLVHACIFLPLPLQTGIISPVQQILDLRCLEMMRLLENEATRHSLRLRDIARYISWHTTLGLCIEHTYCGKFVYAFVGLGMHPRK